MGKFSLSKNQSLAVFFVITGIFGNLAFAQTSQSTNGNPIGLQLTADDLEKPKVKSYLDSWTATQNQNSLRQNCTEAKKDFAKAIQDFSDGCSKSRLPSNGSSAKGEIACSKAIQECTKCADADGEDGAFDCGKATDGDDGQSGTDVISKLTNPGGGNSSSDPADQIVPDLKQLKTNYAYCPQNAAKDLKDLRDEVKDSQKDVDDLKNNQIPDKQKEINEAESQNKKDKQDLQDQLDQAAQDRDDNRKKLTDDLNQIKDGLAEQVTKLTQQISDAQDALRASSSDRMKIQIAWSDAIAALDRECRAQAQAQLTALRQQKYEQAKNSTFSTGSFQSLLYSTGLTSRQREQQLINQWFSQCRNDPAYSAGLNRASSIKATAESEASNRENQLNKAIDSAKAAIAQINVGPDSKLAKALQSTKDSLQAEVDKFDKKQQQIQTKAQALQDEYQKKSLLLQTQLNGLQDQLKRESNYLTQKRNFLALRNKAAPGGESLSSSDADAANSKYGDLEPKALAVMESCQCDSGEEGVDSNGNTCTLTSSGSGPYFFNAVKSCNQARNFLNNLSGSDDTDTQLASSSDCKPRTQPTSTSREPATPVKSPEASQ